MAEIYLDNVEFEKLLTACMSPCASSEVRNELARSFYLLATRISRILHLDDEDALQSAVMACWTVKDQFNSARGKAFTFFTEICFQDYFRYAKKRKRIKKLYQDYFDRCRSYLGEV